MPGQEYVTIRDLLEHPSLDHVIDRGLAFLFFAGNEQYLDVVRERYPGGKAGEVRSPRGQHVFYSYLVTSEVIRSDSQQR